MRNAAAAISIVIPTCNGAATLPTLLEALRRQRIDRAVEIIAVDSGSTDGSTALLRQRVDRLITIGAREFDHGLTRNLGIEHASGALVVLIVQDALPANDQWLAALTAPLVTDPSLAGTYARQLPRPGASGLARHYLSRSPVSLDRPRTHEHLSVEALASLTPPARLTACTFDNVCSCIRRSVWVEHPFRSAPIAEDLIWAKEVLLAGYRLAFAPAAEVFHSHDRSVRYEFVRTYQLHRPLNELFGLKTIPATPDLVRAIVSSSVLHLRYRKTPSAVSASRAAALALAWPLGQFLGAKAANRRRGSGHPPA